MSYLPPGHAPLKFHPVADLFPMISDKELDDLGDDIKANGQVETVKLHRGMILDGRNRYTACARKNLGVRTELFEGTDREALNWAISKNLKRRHMNESQRAMVAARLATLKLGANQHSAAPIGAGSAGGTADLLREVAPAPEPEPAISQTEAAEMMTASRRSVQRAAKVIEAAAPEVVNAVDTGKISVAAAVDIAALPVAEQRAIIAKADPKAVKQVAKDNRAEKAKAGRERRLDNMRKVDATPLLDGGEKIGVFYVDIPREFESWSAETGADKNPEMHYRVERLRFLADLRGKILSRALPNSVMIMWAWANSLQDQLDLLAEWGFASVRRRDENGLMLRDASGEILPPVGEGRYRSHQVWVKRAATGILNRGMGFWFIDCHELMLIGCRGDVPAPLQGTQAMSVIEALIGAHSEKPNEIIRDQIDHYFPGVRKLELFGRVPDMAAFRARHPDWDVIGNDSAIERSDGALASSREARAQNSGADLDALEVMEVREMGAEEGEAA